MPDDGWSRGYEKESPTEPPEEPPDGHCPKCEHEEVNVSNVRMTEGGAQWLAGVDLSSFSVASCDRCGYSEFYRGSNHRNILRHFLVTDG